MIFLLGGRGFYGSAIARMLDLQGRTFRVITRENYADFRGQKCQVFINANGNSSKLLAKRAPLEDFDASVRSVRNSLVDFEYDTYVYLSSVDVYADCSRGKPNGESVTLEPAKQSGYGFHKALAEQCVKHVARRWLIARLGGAVGPGLKKNAVFDILNGGPLWLDPESRLQFLQTDDAARMLMSLIDRGIRNEIFNVCGRGTIALREVIEAARKTIAVRPGSPRVHYEVDVSRLGRLVEIPETRATVLSFVRNATSPFPSTVPEPHFTPVAAARR